jgi:hypothetical protein
MISRRSTGISLFGTAVAATLLGGPAGPAAATTAPSHPADCSAIATFDRSQFDSHPKVTNKWFPLDPGTQFDMQGTVVEAGVTHRHRIVTTVTNLTKTLDGVRTVVVHDLDYDNGQLQESELAFMAQDRSGAVWNVGEYPEEYVGGKLDGAPRTWISGIAGARAGIGMVASPRVGDRPYLQGSAPAVEFRDCAQVVQTGQRVCVPVCCFDNVLVTVEWAPLDPAGGDQFKYYAPGVGSIQVKAVGGDTPENLQLAALTKLDGSTLWKVNQAALAQDARGYRVSPDVYARTPRAVLGY